MGVTRTGKTAAQKAADAAKKKKEEEERRRREAEQKRQREAQQRRREQDRKEREAKQTAAQKPQTQTSKPAAQTGKTKGTGVVATAKRAAQAASQPVTYYSNKKKQEPVQTTLRTPLDKARRDARFGTTATGRRRTTETSRTAPTKEDVRRAVETGRRNWETGRQKLSTTDTRRLNEAQQRQVRQAKQRYDEARRRGDTAGMEKAHREAENIRLGQGYSGGASGAQYHSYNPTQDEYNRLNQAGIAELRKANLMLERARNDQEAARARRRIDEIMRAPGYRAEYGANANTARGMRQTAEGRTTFIGASPEQRRKDASQFVDANKAAYHLGVGGTMNFLDATGRALQTDAARDQARLQNISDIRGGGQVNIPMPQERTEPSKWERMILQGQAEQAASSEGLYPAEKWLNDVYISGVQSLPTTAAALIPGAGPLAAAARAVTLGGMGASAAGNRLLELEKAGIPFDRAYRDATVAGLIEAGTEAIGVERLAGMAAGRIPGTFARQILGQAAAEGAEEGLAYLGNWGYSKAMDLPGQDFDVTEMLSQMGAGALLGAVHAGASTMVSEIRNGGTRQAERTRQNYQYWQRRADEARNLLGDAQQWHDMIEQGAVSRAEGEQVLTEIGRQLLGQETPITREQIRRQNDMLDVEDMVLQGAMSEGEGRAVQRQIFDTYQAQERQRQAGRLWDAAAQVRPAERAPGYARAMRDRAQSVLARNRAEQTQADPFEDAVRTGQEAIRTAAEELQRREAPDQAEIEAASARLAELEEQDSRIALDGVRGFVDRLTGQDIPIEEVRRHTAELERARAAVRQLTAQTERPFVPVQETPAPPASAPSSQTGRRAAMLDSMASTFGESGAAGLRSIGGKMTAGQGAFVRNYTDVYNQVLGGRKESQITRPQGMTDDQYFAAVTAAQNDRKTGWDMDVLKAAGATGRNKNAGVDWRDQYVRQMDRKTARTVDGLAKALGVRVVFAEEGTILTGTGARANADIQGNVVTIEKNNPNPVRMLIGHEMTHRMQDVSPESYQAFRDYVMSVPGSMDAMERMLARYQEAGAFRDDQNARSMAMDELAADFAGEMLENSEQLREFIRQNYEKRTVLEAIRDAFRSLRDKLTGRHRIQADEAVRLLEEAIKASSQRVKEMGKNSNAAETRGQPSPSAADAAATSPRGGGKSTTDEIAERQLREQAERLRDARAEMDRRMSLTEAEASMGLATTAAEAEQSTRYSLVTDQALLDELNSGETITVYRAMQIIDGKLYPPMAAKVKSDDGKKTLVAAQEIGEWYQSDEQPELIPKKKTVKDKKTGETREQGYFILDKGDGSTPLNVAYNPYFHTSASPLNDQFSSAHKRPNLVTVECEIPKSELTSGYRAEFAKDTVGETKWHAGPVASKLKGAKARRVFLSRWAKVNRIVPDAEVARIIANTLKVEDVAVPTNVVTPSLLAELRKNGVKIEEVEGKGGRFSLSSAEDARQRFSLAGRAAQTAEMQMFRQARKMWANEVDEETIRQETGWFIGPDDHWRFEINDQGASFDPDGNVRGKLDVLDAQQEISQWYNRLMDSEDDDLLDAVDEVNDITMFAERGDKAKVEQAVNQAVRGLKDKGINTKTFETWTQQKVALWANDFTGDELWNRTLADYLDHPELFRAYPQLQNVILEFKALGNAYGQFYVDSDMHVDLDLNNLKDDDSIMDTLAHELQHAIQYIEAFANGASPEYWAEKKKTGRAIRTKGEEARLHEIGDKIIDISIAEPEMTNEAFELYQSTPTVPRGKFDFDKWEQVEEDPPQWKEYDAKRDALEEKYGYKVIDLLDLYYQNDRLTKGKDRSPFELYWKTAGEVEAREVSSRRKMSDEERRKNPPKLGGDDVVFAGSRFSIGAQADADYLSAVERGDMETAQRMVDEAAKAAGYTIKAYHGTPKKFNVFSKFRIGSTTDYGWFGRGFYFTTKKDVADVYAGYLPDSNVIEAYLKVRNPFVFTEYPGGEDMSPGEIMQDVLGKKYGSRGELTEDDKAQRSEDFTEWLAANGYDGVEVWSQVMILDSEQAKRTDPVTYDDDGNVIPLSERFNEEKGDIRYSLDNVIAFPQNGRGSGAAMNEAMQDEKRANELRQEVRDLEDKLEFAEYDDSLSDAEIRRMRNRLFKAQSDLDKLIAKERSLSRKTAITDLLDDLDYYRRSDLESLAEQISDGAWDDIEDLSDDDLRDSLRDMLNEWKDGMSPLEAQAAKYGFYVRPPARYSLGGTEQMDAVALMRENQLLRDQLEQWKSQVKPSDRTKVKPEEVQKLARRLAKDYSTGMDTEEIAKTLQGIYDGMGRDLSYERAYEEAGKLARAMIEEASETEDSLYRQYRDLREHFRETPLIISPEMKADISADYGDWRKRHFGRMKLKAGDTTNVDQVFQEAVNYWPELFSEDVSTTPADQVLRIAEVLDSVYAVQEFNPYAGDMDAAAGYLAAEIMESFWDMPNVQKTFADKAEEKLARQRDRTEEEKQKRRDAVQEEREKGKGKLDRANLRADWLEAKGRHEERRKREAALAKLRKEHREKFDRALAKAREDRDARLQAQKEKYLGQKRANSRKQKERELRAKIQRHVSKLSTKLLRGTDAQHIPEDLRLPVATALDSINLSGKDGKPTKRTQAFSELQAAYRDVLENGGEIVVDPALIWQIDKIIGFRDTPIANLGLDDLTTVWDVVKAVEASISTYNKMLGRAKFETISEPAFGIRDYLTGRKNRGDFRGPFRQMDRLLNFGMLTPEGYFLRLGESGKGVFKMIRDAQDRNITILKDAEAATREIIKPGRHRKLEKQKHTFNFDGQTVELTTAQIMNLYVLMGRQQAVDHIMVGGFRPDSVKKGIKDMVPPDAWHLTQDQVSEVLDSLTEAETKIADGLRQYIGTELTRLGNEASMEVYGYKKFREKSYWPIETDKNQVQSDVKNDAVSGTVAGWGSAKPLTPHANNAVIVRSIFDVYADHVTGMAKYASWLAAMENLNRIFNFRYKGEDGHMAGGVKTELERAFGKNGSGYWKNLMDDLNAGVKARSDNPFQALTGAYKASAIAGNIRVIVQQPTAILRALDMLNPADIAAGMALARPGKWDNTVKQYAPIAVWKDWGYFTADTGKQMRNVIFGDDNAVQRLNYFFMNNPVLSPGAADSVTWTAIWNAVEIETRRKRKDLWPKSEEYYQAVADRFNDVIDHTQVVDGIPQRSQIMRSTSDVTKMATSFMSEPTKSYNMMTAAVYEARNAKGAARGKAMAKLGRSTLALMASFAVNAAVQSIVDAVRDDDKDEEYWEKFLQAYFGEGGETRKDQVKSFFMEGNLGAAFNPATYIPFVKDILSIGQGYTVSRMDMDVISKVIKEAQNVQKAMNGDGKKTVRLAWINLAAEASRFLGMPVANIKRDILAFSRTFFTQTGNYRMQYELEKFMYDETNPQNMGEFAKLILGAERAGDDEAAEYIRQAMISAGADGEKLDKKLASLRKTAVEDSQEFQTALAKRTDAYTTMLDASPQFQALDEGQQEKARGMVEDYAKWQAYGDQVELNEKDRKAFEKMQTAEADRIDPALYALCVTAFADIHSDKDASGKEVKGQRRQDKVIRYIRALPDLTTAQRSALYHLEYDSDENNPWA